MRSENYCWVMLGLAWLVIFSSWAFIFSTPTIINDIMLDLSLTHGEAGLILSGPVSMFVLFSIPGGLLADRFGVKRAIGIATVFLGLFGFLRAFAPDFTYLFGFSVLLGAGIALAVPSVPKLVATWFPAERIGTATGVYLSGNGIGGWVAMALTVSVMMPMVGDWRGALLVYGVIGLLVSACWWGLARPAPPTQLGREVVPIKYALSNVVRNGDLWLVAGILFCINTIGFGVLEWLPFVLEQRGMESAVAALATSVFFLMFPTVLLFPALSDRVKLRKPFIWIPGLIYIPVTYLLLTAADLYSVLALVTVCGICMYGAYALTFILPIDIVGEQLAGNAAGFILAFGYAGALLAPPVVGILRDVTGTFSLGTFLLMVVAAVWAISGFLMREIGGAKRQHAGNLT